MKNVYTKKIKIVIFLFCLKTITFAQSENDFYFQASKYAFGGGIGVSHYQGDLNPDFSTIVPGWSAAVFAKRNYSNHVALKYQLSAMNFGYSSQFASNQWRQSQNLDFQTNLIEFSVQSDFNFFYYKPSVYGHNFTPYISIGLGVFYFDPYTYFKGQKTFLRNLKTEGNDYLPISISFPIGFGLKWGVNKFVNMGVEISYRETLTDYIDDVSQKYVSNPSTPLANQLANPSQNNTLATQNKQRGLSNAFDNFLTLQIYLSFNLYKYFCP